MPYYYVKSVKDGVTEGITPPPFSSGLKSATTYSTYYVMLFTGFPASTNIGTLFFKMGINYIPSSSIYGFVPL
jgi:hypothetical protein